MKISTGTWIRTICLALAIINKILVWRGVSPLPIDDEMVTAIVSDLAIIITSIIAWWKNNSFTMAAILGDETMKHHRQRKKLYKGQ